MTSVIAALIFGGNWQIFDKNSINTSFPLFSGKLNNLELRLSENFERYLLNH